MSVAGDYIGRVRLGVTIGVAGSQSFVWPDGRPDGTYTADAGADGAIELTVTEVGDDGLTVAWAADASRRMIGHPWRVLRDGTWLFGDLYVTEAEPTDLDPAEFTVLDGTVEVQVAMVAPSSGGTIDRPVLASADWWTEASNRFATVVPDRSRWAEHGQPAVTPTEIPDGTYLMGETISDPNRPRVPDHARLEFANGVRIMWRANHALPNGWQPMDTNPTGYSDIIAHQALDDGGLTDSLEAGLRKDPDDDLVRVFLDEVTAGEDPEAPEGDTQTFSDPLDPELYEGMSDFCVDVTWGGGTRTYEIYVPNPTATDLLTPGEAVEAWELHSTATRTAGPGFYASGLPWYLGDSLILAEFVKLFDLGTGDLALDFQATEAVAGGWTDGAGNPWTHGADTTPHVAVAPDDLILLPSTTIPSRAADPGAGDWTLMYDGVLDPTASPPTRVGTIGDDIAGNPGWGLCAIPAEYGGTQLVFNDGATLVSAVLGITDADRHLIIARLDRTAGTLEVTVDGEVATLVGDPGDLGRIDGAEDFTLAIGTVLRGLAVWSRCLTDEEAAALAAEVAAPSDAYDPVGSATGGGSTGPAGPAGADGADGQDGADGASAYEVAVTNGFVGDETAWLASLVGPQGDPGADGADGQAGADGSNGSGETWAVNIDCTTAPHATTGTAPSITVNTASLNNGYLSTANSTGSGATFKRYFTAGTYDIKVRARNLGASSGRGEILVDGVSKGYFDTSVSTATNVLHTVATGVSIAEGAREITVASYDRGTGATSWAVFVQTIDLIRTA